ncbi:uncharacterized protein AMSG_01418 [Thecamonas trahens ATCC 50062]|uniref:Uncharacterized protein n=1 Tax=Thecamonas trahens ATCC 50062 TaxID=461836 RepID=A0A0L0DN22_THETB|nr:hypothetical protein AMSG_01418 [Thecamonas trahens ATCC 50062]KNC53707.1 hypothetical protein AMSG_01418 [Thecamonas trahens ATCC 50062]|eukprot:XP_013762021.1 hypothetical protein AMSG_01418 [Thecamonas trahens ATCC 50062]
MPLLRCIPVLWPSTAELWAAAQAVVEAEAKALEEADVEPWESTYRAELADNVPEPLDIDEAVLGTHARKDDVIAGSYAELVHDVPLSVWRDRLGREQLGTATTGANAFGRNAGFSQPIHEYDRAYTKIEEGAPPPSTASASNPIKYAA